MVELGSHPRPPGLRLSHLRERHKAPGPLVWGADLSGNWNWVWPMERPLPFVVFIFTRGFL